MTSRDAQPRRTFTTHATLVFFGRDSRDSRDTSNGAGYSVPTCPDLGAMVGTNLVRQDTGTSERQKARGWFLACRAQARRKLRQIAPFDGAAEKSE